MGTGCSPISARNEFLVSDFIQTLTKNNLFKIFSIVTSYIMVAKLTSNQPATQLVGIKSEAMSLNKYEWVKRV